MQDISQYIEVHYSSAVLSHTHKLTDYLALLAATELATLEKFKFDDLKQRYIINHGVLRQLLAQYVNDSPQSLRIEIAEFGKPFLVDYPELSFNMSHSGDILAIAISEKCQLGIDVERYKARTTWEGLVNKCFSVEEADYWAHLEPAQQGAAFYQFWVKKEAFVKAVGKGISLGLKQSAIDPESLQRFLRVPELAGQAAQWHIHSFDIAENVYAAVVCDINNAVLRLHKIGD